VFTQVPGLNTGKFQKVQIECGKFARKYNSEGERKGKFS